MCVVVKYPDVSCSHSCHCSSTDLSLLCTTGDCYILLGDLVAFSDNMYRSKRGISISLSHTDTLPTLSDSVTAHFYVLLCVLCSCAGFIVKLMRHLVFYIFGFIYVMTKF